MNERPRAAIGSLEGRMVRRFEVIAGGEFQLDEGNCIMKKIIIGSALLAAFATPAQAQDAAAFSGPWVGANVGYDSIGAEADEAEEDGSEDGVAFGVALGYDFNLNGVVLGIEGEIGESTVNASGTDVLEDGDLLELSAGRDIYAGLRIGVPVSDNVMVYAKGGYTNLRFDAAYTLDDETVEDGSNSDGWRAGAGVEFAFGQPFARVEYRYSDYGSFDDAELETSRHQVMLTAGLRF